MKTLIILLVISIVSLGCQVTAIYPTRTVEVTKVVTVPRHFDSLEELAVWLEKVPIPRGLGWDCRNYSMELQNRAATDGYIINIVIGKNQYYNSFFEKFDLAGEGIHAFNSVLIDGIIWYVEPQNYEISRGAAVMGKPGYYGG